MKIAPKQTCYYCHRFHNERNYSVLGKCRKRVSFVLKFFFVIYLMAILECRLGYLANAGMLNIRVCLFPLHPHMKFICHSCGWHGVVGPLMCRPVSPPIVVVRNMKQWERSFRANLRFLSTKAHCARMCGFPSQLIQFFVRGFE